MRILSGKTEEYSYFLSTYADRVFSLILQIVGKPEDAEELTQDVFVKAFEKLSSFHADSSFSTWIYRIAYNMALSALRKQKCDGADVVTMDDKQWGIISDEEIDSSLNDESEEQIAALRRAVAQLEPEERAIVTWFYDEEKPIAEIARILNQTESNVKVKLYRIRKKIYVLMKAEEETNDK